MTVEISCGLPPGPDFSCFAALAEELGYTRIWIFDSAPLWEDPFIHLALAAQCTKTIGLGSAVLIPSERSQMATASAIATIARLSEGRFRACFGTGATARRTLGQKPLTLRTLGDYVTSVRALLAGDTVVIDGKLARMLHAQGLALDRPVDIEIWLSAFGPRAVQLAERVADGIIGSAANQELPVAVMQAGTVLDPQETRNSSRVRAAVGPWRVVAYHEAYTIGGAKVVDAMAGGTQWRERVEGLATADGRHLLAYEGHVTHLTERDQPLADFTGGFPAMIGGPDEIAVAIASLAQSGIQELIYTPSGPNVARELRAFAGAAHAHDNDGDD